MMMMMHHHRPELGGRSGGLPTMRMKLRAHHLIDEVMGFPWSPHLPSSAGYSSQTAPVPAMVAAGGPEKEACAQLISSLLRRNGFLPPHREPRGNSKRRPERGRAELSNAFMLAI